ncbi:MAG: prolipoprotein diacylglyceryl transferase [Anaerolineae bacterium]|nr:prolipoprotein diacylglyceryl transferase [Anaerolineae bacterium]
MVDPVLVRLGPFAIRWYGVLVIGGAVLAAYFSARGAKRRGQNPEYVWDMLIWVLFLGIVGARLYHVFSSAEGQVGWEHYRQHPLDALKIWEGGLAIYGALVGGFVGLATYSWYHKLDLVLWMDIVFPNVLLAQAIGRWGNFVNQEAYGPPTDLPWAIYISPPHRLPGYEEYSHFHPVFLYESIWAFAGWVLLGWLSRRYGHRLRKGDLTALYFVWYPVGRFFTEGLRVDAWKVGGMPTAQWISLVAAVAAIGFLVARRTVLNPVGADPQAR